MMNKILCIVLALMMVLSLAACGGTKTEAPKTEEPKNEEPKTETPEKEPEKEPEKAPEKETPDREDKGQAQP